MITNLNKELPFDTARKFLTGLKANGHKIIQCHGTFDLLHPGHIYHLEEAKALGDLLVVTITGEQFVNKGPGRPIFSDKLRVKALTALAVVDYVIVIPFPAAVEAIRCVGPHIYCKGTEYANADNDVTGNIHGDVKTVTEVGGQIRYLGSVVFSSSRLINNNFNRDQPGVSEFCKTLAGVCSPEEFRSAVDKFKSLRVLVIGDTIIDRYSYVKVQGLTSKNRILSGRFLSQDSHAGGALAVVRHLRNFAGHVDLISLVGDDSNISSFLASHLPMENDLVIREKSFQTVIKERFVEPVSEGKELSKLFSVNYIDAQPPPPEVVQKVYDALEKYGSDYDLVAVADFGHGVMAPSIRQLVETKAKFMALNCQTNSNNHGFNIISNQYKRTDSFSLDEQELLLAVAHRHINHEQELEKLRLHFNATYAWLTRGSVKTIGIKDGRFKCTIPPLASTVSDTIGAGDAFFAVSSLAACLGYRTELATFMGQLAGAQAVGIVGNIQAISKEKLVKSGMTMLTY